MRCTVATGTTMRIDLDSCLHEDFEPFVRLLLV